MSSPSVIQPPASSSLPPESGLLEEEHPARRFEAWATWLIVAVIILVRIPFLLLHALQEDAYITLGSARHLAEQGDFSFNLHQHFPGTASLLYPLFVAAIDLLSPRVVVVGEQIFGIVCIAAGCWFITRALCTDLAQQRTAWLLTACWPIALVMSYSGTEAPLLALVLGICIFALARPGHSILFAAGILLLPLVRPDAIAYALLFCIAMFLLDRRAAFGGVAALAGGCGLFLSASRITSGHLLPTSIRATEIAYHPGHDLSSIIDRLTELFFDRSFLVPTSDSYYLIRLSPVFLLFAIAAFALAFHLWRGRRERIVLGTLAIATVLLPLAYAYNGVLVSRYLYPANWIAATVAIVVLIRLLMTGTFRIAGAALLAIIWIALIFLQWTNALATSARVYHYRGDIGRYLAAISHGRGTLFLEPAGIIPYLSGLSADDETAVVSPRIVGFMERNPDSWWFDYVSTAKPDYIVQRASFDEYRTAEDYTLTPDQQSWFQQHYKLLRRAHYAPATYHPSPFLQKILALAPIEDYLIFARRDLDTSPRGGSAR
jgi:hypothetical protein